MSAQGLIEDTPKHKISTIASRRSVGIGCALVGAMALLVWLLDQASLHSFGANSDGATVVLEGYAMSTGHLLLPGWSLSLDSFWSIDASLYAVAEAVVGLRHELLNVVPSVVAVFIIVVGAIIARDHRSGIPAVFGAGLVVALLGLPSPDLSFFLLQGPWHVGTALWCLIAFWGLSFQRFRLGWVLAIVMLCAGLLGDFQTIGLGVAPVFFAGLTAIARRRTWRAGMVPISAAFAASALAIGVRFLAVQIGTYSAATSYASASPHHWLINVKHIGSWSAALMGAARIRIGPRGSLSAQDVTNGPTALHLIHGIAFVGVMIGLVTAVVFLFVGLIGKTRSGDGAKNTLVDDLLLFAVAGSCVLFVVLCPNGNGDYARYLTAGVIFAVILTARFVARAVSHLHRRQLWISACIGALLIGAFAFGLVFQIDEPAAPQSAAALGSFLSSHDLRTGIGDYWSSSIVTVETNSAVKVRPVLLNPALQFIAYARQTDASWYENPFQFFVYNTARPWGHDNAKTATRAFGTPSHIYVVGTYRVLTWSHSLAVAPAA